jgi:hypothetical protein
MFLDNEFRKSKRFEHKATVMLEDKSYGYFSYAQMSNFSGGGMSFETDFTLIPGAKITINLDKPLFRAAPMAYDAIVKWCKELSKDDSSYSYGIGAKYL